ncbi:MAG: TetR/AcrR family transcriptional regulator [Salinisphaeraceae bacterium]
MSNDSGSAERVPRKAGEGAARPTSRRGRPTGDHKAKRAELLKAAIKVIARDGYVGASLRKVARQAGYTTGAVTYYFSNKDAMLTAVVESMFDEFDALLSATQDPSDVETILTQWLKRTSADTEFWPVMFQLLAHARHEPAFAAVIEQRYARLRQVLAATLERGQDQGVIRGDIPADLLADQLSAISDGWMMMLPVEPERFAPERLQGLLQATIALISPLSDVPDDRLGR